MEIYRPKKGDVIIVNVGDENHDPTDRELISMRKDFSDFFQKMNIHVLVLPYYVKINTILVKKEINKKDYFILSEEEITKMVVGKL